MKIGLVGNGSIGSRHAANARALGHDVKIYDPMNVMDFRFERKLYDWCDAAVIATPSQFHESGIRAAVERGKHVLAEKPISVAIGGLPAILDSADEKNLVVMVGNNLRLHPCVQEARRHLTFMGKPLWANFICCTMSEKRPYLSDGVILNTGAHEVDLALFLLGPVKRVASAVARTGDYGDELAHFTLEHDNGAYSSFVLNFITMDEVREFWISTEKGNLGVNLPQRVLVVGESNIAPAPGSFDDDYRNEMMAFTDRIEGKLAPGATGRDGLATLRVLLDVRKMAGLK